MKEINLKKALERYTTKKLSIMIKKLNIKKIQII